ncbi:MAG: LPS-assembly protein LptD [Candidatus Omnitrophica bacterium]|nr:LPS-assembly protein LptD [Candidatus Omnitrophota bacterium]
MIKYRLYICLLCSIFLSGSFPLLAAESSSLDSASPKKTKLDLPIQDIFSHADSKVETQADTVEYDKNTHVLIAKKNVVITHLNMQITADYAEVETATKKSFARGHVTIFRNGKAVAHGEEIHYNFANQSGSFPDGRTYNAPWFSSGEDIQQIREGVKIVRKAHVTTCDLKNPHYEIRARKVTVYDGDKMVAWNVTFYALGKPIFWVPVLVMPLQDNNIPLAVVTGYNSRQGFFISALKGFSITKNIWGKFRADWRSKRGFGAGTDISYGFEKTLGYGNANIYLANDHEAPTPGSGEPFHKSEDRLRGRITWKHRKDFDPYSYGLLRYNRFADEYFLQDFFEREFQGDIQPNSFISLVKNSERYGLLAYGEKRMNKFESSVERLPQVQADWRTQPFLNPHIFYQSQLSYNNLVKDYGRIKIRGKAHRADTFHEWSSPLHWQHIHFTPHILGRGTYYSRLRDSEEDRFRAFTEMGGDLRTRFYRLYDVHFDKAGFEINQLRHIIEPNLQYSASMSSLSDEKLEIFDDSVERLDDAQKVTLGVENRIQTKRTVHGQMQRVDLVSLNTFLSYELYPDGRTGSELFAPRDNQFTKSDFSTIGQEIVFRPYEWLHYLMRFDYDTRDNQFHMFNQDIVIKTGKFTSTIGQRYAADIPEFHNSNQFVFDTNYRLNPLWDMSGYIRWDTFTSDLSEWQLSARRDLHDFILTLGYDVRNSDIRSSNKTLFVEFYLKAFPEVGLHAGGSRASFGAPRMGDTVAGSGTPLDSSATALHQNRYQ